MGYQAGILIGTIEIDIIPQEVAEAAKI